MKISGLPSNIQAGFTQVKAAFVGLVGRPSSGKSTLINRICGQKVSIISPVPQTTRNRVRGIYSSERGQLVFVDTPGFHLSEKKINLHLKIFCLYLYESLINGQAFKRRLKIPLTEKINY